MENELQRIVGDIEHAVDCPICSKKIPVTLNDFFAGNRVKCPSCQSLIELGLTET